MLTLRHNTSVASVRLVSKSGVVYWIVSMECRVKRERESVRETLEGATRTGGREDLTCDHMRSHAWRVLKEFCMNLDLLRPARRVTESGPDSKRIVVIKVNSSLSGPSHPSHIIASRHGSLSEIFHLHSYCGTLPKRLLFPLQDHIAQANARSLSCLIPSSSASSRMKSPMVMPSSFVIGTTKSWWFEKARSLPVLVLFSLSK